jgi:hypothetical protein
MDVQNDALSLQSIKSRCKYRAHDQLYSKSNKYFYRKLPGSASGMSSHDVNRIHSARNQTTIQARTSRGFRAITARDNQEARKFLLQKSPRRLEENSNYMIILQFTGIGILASILLASYFGVICVIIMPFVACTAKHKFIEAAAKAAIESNRTRAESSSLPVSDIPVRMRHPFPKALPNIEAGESPIRFPRPDHWIKLSDLPEPSTGSDVVCLTLLK